MFTAKFWKDALERAIKTAAQTFLATAGVNAWKLDGDYWTEVGLVVAGATVLSLVTSLVSSQVGNSTDASLVTGTGVGK